MIPFSLCFFFFPLQVVNAFTNVCSENVSKLFAPHPAKRFEPGEHYYLFVDFSSVEEAQKAMETLNGQQGPWGGPLRVQRARGITTKPEERKVGVSSEESQV